MSSEILLILVVALLLDRVVGDPDWLWSRLPHPVVFFGKAIAVLDGALNRHEALEPTALKLRGVVAIGLLLLASAAVGAVLHRVFGAMGLIGFLSRPSSLRCFWHKRALATTSRVLPKACGTVALKAGVPPSR